MTQYRNADTVTPKRRSAGTTITIVLVVIAAIVCLLFATGFRGADNGKK